jgi:tRNA threonylcarbamoyladenosine biosynthesis protein TsaE
MRTGEGPEAGAEGRRPEAAHWTVVTGAPEETAALGRLAGACARPGDAILLEGPVGAGKTVLASGVLEGLGVAGPHPSPTFPVLRLYRGRLPAVHADLYRLAGVFDPEEVGWDEALGGSAVLVVEWAGHLGRWAPEDALWIHLEPADGSGPALRRIACRATGPEARRLLEDLRRAWGARERDT